MTVRPPRATIGLLAVCSNLLLTAYGCVAAVSWLFAPDPDTTGLALFIYLGLAVYSGLPLFLLTRWGAPAGLWRKPRAARARWETVYVRAYTYNLLLVGLLFLVVFTKMALADAAQRRIADKAQQEYKQAHQSH